MVKVCPKCGWIGDQPHPGATSCLRCHENGTPHVRTLSLEEAREELYKLRLAREHEEANKLWCKIQAMERHQPKGTQLALF